MQHQSSYSAFLNSVSLLSFPHFSLKSQFLSISVITPPTFLWYYHLAWMIKKNLSSKFQPLYLLHVSVDSRNLQGIFNWAIYLIHVFLVLLSSVHVYAYLILLYCCSVIAVFVFTVCTTWLRDWTITMPPARIHLNNFCIFQLFLLYFI